MTPEGDCPTCGRSLEAPPDGELEGSGVAGEAVDEGAPWHFKLLIVAAVAYLVWRFYQLFFG